MPQTLIEGKLTFTFPDELEVVKYDDWAFYRHQVGRLFDSSKARKGAKGVDFLALHRESKTLWLIEVKDLREHSRAKGKVPLWDEVALKAWDTLAGIFSAQANASNAERQFAGRATKAIVLRVVLHLEQPAHHSKLFPRVYFEANLRQKLTQMLRPIDAHPKVTSLNSMQHVPWQAH